MNMQPPVFVKQIIKPLNQRVHKKQRGQLLIVVGSKHMPGAGLLTVRAALRTGAGLVTVAYPAGLATVYRQRVLEVLHLMLPQTKEGTLALRGYAALKKSAATADAVAVGPGLTRNPATASLVVRLTKGAAKPLIIDADGLNALADSGKVTAVLRSRKALVTILTPHAGEMARLTGLSVAAINKDKKRFALAYARRWRSIVVLKGYQTVVASPAGQVVVNQTGGPFLATAGSGDVLTGMAATLVAQNPDQPFEATATAVYLHGLAGEAASRTVGELSVIASDLIVALPTVLTNVAAKGKIGHSMRGAKRPVF